MSLENESLTVGMRNHEYNLFEAAYTVSHECRPYKSFYPGQEIIGEDFEKVLEGLLIVSLGDFGVQGFQNLTQKEADRIIGENFGCAPDTVPKVCYEIADF